MIFSKKILFTAAIMSVAAFSFFAKGHALAETGCNLTPEQFEQLKNLQSGSVPDDRGKIREELNLRKSLLKSVVDCAINETESLKESFSAIKISDEETRSLQNQFLPWFSDMLNYYDLQKGLIGDLGLQGSKEFAKNFQTWRAGNFKPTAKLVADFILWSQNQELMQIAENRLSQMKRGVEIFGLGLNEEIRNGLADSEKEFKNAKSLNDGVKEKIRSYDSSDGTLDLIRSSLEALSSAYKKLFDLAEKINKSLIK